jgi:hypothetical protein
VARKRYPSDEARLRVRPHVRVHLTVATHRKIAATWAQPELRGMLVELWRIAREAHAGKTRDVVALSPAAVRSITGKERHAFGVRALVELCEGVGYQVSTDPAAIPCGPAPTAHRVVTDPHRLLTASSPIPHGVGAVFVWIRNFAKKQDLDSAPRGVTPRNSAPSESESESESERSRNTEYERGGGAHSAESRDADRSAAEPARTHPGSPSAGEETEPDRTDPPEGRAAAPPDRQPSPEPETPEARSALEDEEDPTRGIDPAKLARLLAGRPDPPGTTTRAWIEAHLPHLVAAAELELVAAGVEPTRRALEAAVRDRLFAFHAQELRSGARDASRDRDRPKPERRFETAEETSAALAARREEARASEEPQVCAEASCGASATRVRKRRWLCDEHFNAASAAQPAAV